MSLESVRATLEARGVTVSWPPYASSAGGHDLDRGRHERRPAVPVLRAPPRAGQAVRVGFIGAGAVTRLPPVGARDARRRRGRRRLRHRRRARLGLAAGVGAVATTNASEAAATPGLDAVFVCTPPAHHVGPTVAGARAWHRRLPREAARPLARGRPHHRRCRREEQRGLQRRLPVAQPGRARAAARRARRCHSGPADQPQPRLDRRRPERRRRRRRRRLVVHGRRGAAAASCSSSAATTSTCSARSPARSRRCRPRRDAGTWRSPATPADDLERRGRRDAALRLWRARQRDRRLDRRAATAALHARRDGHGPRAAPRARPTPHARGPRPRRDGQRAGERQPAHLDARTLPRRRGTRRPRGSVCSPADAFGTLAALIACEQSLADGAVVPVETL